MSENSFPSLTRLLPHGAGMIMLEDIIGSGEGYTVCRAVAGRAPLGQSRSEPVPICWGLEYMAQTAAAHAGLRARPNAHPRRGLLLGTRRLDCTVPVFQPGQVLRVTAKLVHDEGPLSIFDCAIEDEQARGVLMQGQLSFYLPDEQPGSV